MADCGNLDYQLIELQMLSHLRKSFLLRAQINSIDRVNNVADITLLDECEDLGDVDMSEVPFWYHCEDSSGTLDDLERGHLAFSDLDFVYIIHSPAHGENGAVTYISGHVDIKGTKKCTLPEFVKVTFGTWVTVYDVSTGATLDLSGFTGLAGSPDPPIALPCPNNVSFGEWFDYNFRGSVAETDMPFTSNGYSFLTSFFDTNVVEYGAVGNVFTSNIVKTYRDVYGNPLVNATDTNYYNGIHSYNPSAITFTAYIEKENGLGVSGITISDLVASETIDVSSSKVERLSTSFYQEIDNFTFNISQEHEFMLSRMVDGVYIDDISNEYSSEMSGVCYNWYVNGYDYDPYSGVSRSGDVVRDSAIRNVGGVQYAVGEDGVYSIMPLLWIIRINLHEKDIGLEIDNTIGPSYIPVEPHFAYLTLSPSIVGYNPELELKMVVSPFGKVTQFSSSEIDKHSDISIIQHFNNADSSLSSGLNSTVADLVNSAYSALTVAQVSSTSFNYATLTSYSFSVTAHKIKDAQ